MQPKPPSLLRQNAHAVGQMLNAPIRVYHLLGWALGMLLCSWLSSGCAHAPPPAPLPHTAAPQTEQEIYQRIEASFVMLVIEHENGMSQCSGAVVGYNKSRPVVLTAGHCFQHWGTSKIMVHIDDLADGGDQAEAELLDLDRAHDLALVRITGPMGRPRSPLPIATDELQLYEHVYTMGNPSHVRSVPADGTVAALHRPAPEGGEVMQYTGFCWPGSSGGPIVNSRAEVVGVVLMVATGGDDTIIPSLCFSASLKDIQKLAASNHLTRIT